MKSFLSFFVCVCFAQVCLSAPTEYLTESRINEIKSNLKEIDGLSSKCVDELIQLFNQFRKETAEKQKIGAALDLIGLALRAPACDKPKIDLRHVLESIQNESEEKPDSVTYEQMIKAQDQLCELVPARRVQQAMIILHAFRVDATSDEKENAVLDLVSSTVHSLKTLCAMKYNGNEV